MNERKDASDFLRWLVNTLRAGLQDKDHSMDGNMNMNMNMNILNWSK